MLSVSSSWTSSTALSSTSVFPLIRLFYGDESSTDYIALSVKDLTHDSVFYKGLLSQNPLFSESIDIATHQHSTSNIELEFINYEYQSGTKLSDLIEDTSLGSGVDIGFYNRKCEIKLTTTGISSWDDSFPFFTGIIREIKHGLDKITFTIEDRKVLKYIDLPKTLVETTNYPQAPESSLGKPIPMVIGDHTFENLEPTVGKFKFSYDNSMVQPMDSRFDRNIFLVANQTIESLTTSDVWLLDTQTNKYMNFDSSAVTVANSSGYATVTLSFSGNTMKLFDWHFPSSSENSAGNFNFSDVGNAGDNDETNFATLAANFTTSSHSSTIRLNFDDYDVGGFTYIDEIEIYYRGNYTLMGGSDSNITVLVNGSGIDVSSPLNVKGFTSGSSIDDAGSSLLGTTNHTIEFNSAVSGDTYKLVYDNTATANIAQGTADSNFKSALEAIANFDDVTVTKSSNQYFTQYKGTSLGKFVNKPDVIDRTNDITLDVAETQNGRTATAEMVGSSASGFLDVKANSSAAVSASVNLKVYYLYKKITLMFEDTRILDRNRFKIHISCKGREYGTWVNGRSTSESFSVNHANDDDAGDLIENPSGVLESIYRDDLGFVDADIDRDSFNVASDILSSYKHAFTLSKQLNSKELIASICRDSRSFSFLGADNTVKHKVLTDTYSASNATITKSEIIKIDFTRTAIDNIKTKIIVHYYPDSSGKLIKQTSATQSTDAQSKYNISADDSTLEYKAVNILDTTTADTLRDYLLKQWQQPHNIVTVTLPPKFTQLEVGDVIEFTDYTDKVFGEDITANATRMSQTIYKYWFITSTNKSINNIKLTAFQLHDLS
tara:strand:+ start:587 stop:3088 length:2502 start_codon:yes stop_codon:yes gene_type:complete